VAVELPAIRTFGSVGLPLQNDRMKPRFRAGLLSAADQTS